MMMVFYPDSNIDDLGAKVTMIYFRNILVLDNIASQIQTSSSYSIKDVFLKIRCKVIKI